MLQYTGTRGFPDTRPSLLQSLRGSAAGESWARFFAFYAPAVMRVARFRGLDDHDADDVVQQVMLAVSRHIGGFEYDRDRGQFRQWVRRITEAKIADHFRRRPRAVTGLELEDQVCDQLTPDELWEQTWEDEWKLQDITFCLETIRDTVAPRTFEAFRMYVIEGASAADTAAALGMSTHHVHVTRCQIIRRVKKQITALREEEGRLEA